MRIPQKYIFALGLIVPTLFIVVLIPELTLNSASIMFLKRTSEDLTIEKNIHITSDDMPQWQKLLCEWRKATNLLGVKDLDQHFIPPLIPRDISPNVTGDNIFLIESACNTQPLYRELCGAESWANRHPEHPVWYVVSPPFIKDTTGLLRNLLEHYPNLHIVGYNLTEAMRPTPLWPLFKSDIWVKNSSWPPNNLSDMLRLQLVWTWGGFYSDSDGICIKSTKGINNVLAHEDNFYIANGCLHGTPRHKFYWTLMKHIAKSFKPDLWGQAGPQAVTKVLRDDCELAKAKKINYMGLAAEETKCNITVLPALAFYPVHWSKLNQLFDQGKGLDFEKRFNQSYAVQFWNKLTQEWPIRVRSQSVLEEVAKRYCPLTYQIASSHGNFF